MPRLMLKLMPLHVLLLSGCATTVLAPPSDCLAYIPDSWREPIPGAPLPDDMDARAWMQFGVETEGALGKANGRTADILHLMTVCERNANKARPRRKILGIL